MAAGRPLLCLTIPREDLLKLRLLGQRRTPTLTEAELGAHILLTWLDGPGQPELYQALGSPRRTRGGRPRPSRTGSGERQTEITEALPPPH